MRFLDPPQTSPPNHGGERDTLPANLPVYDSKTLFRDAREVRIMHRGEIYRLLCTRGGKLILVK